jgi:hypothetical protein
MFRKLILAIGATAAIGAAAFVPTAASAHHFGHGHWGHWGRGFGFGFYGPSYVAAPDCYKQAVVLPNGRVSTVLVCD